MLRIIITLLSILACTSARNWDVILANEDQLSFLTKDGDLLYNVKEFHELMALTFDSIHERVFVSDAKSKNSSLFSVTLDKSPQIKTIVQNNGSIQDIALDTIASTLYWADRSQNAIMSFKLASSFREHDSKIVSIFLKLEDEIPQGIAVDSCQSYLYFTNCNHKKPSVERVRLDGTDREAVVSADLFQPLGLTLDFEEGKIYWTDDREGIYFRIERSNFDGSSRERLVQGRHHKPFSIAIDRNFMYWSDSINTAVWKLPKHKTDIDFQLMYKSEMSPKGLITTMDTDYRDCDILKDVEVVTHDFTSGETDVEVVTHDGTSGETRDKDRYLLTEETASPHAVTSHEQQTKSSSIVSVSYSGETEFATAYQSTGSEKPVKKSEAGNPAQELDTYCVNGAYREINGAKTCLCSPGYSGQRCEVSMCHNYCLHNGTCSVVLEEPVCLCRDGFGGDRCETRMCDGFCLNNGVCDVKHGKPECDCPTNFHGSKCEKLNVEQLCKTYCQYGDVFVPVDGVVPMCVCSPSTHSEHYELLINNENRTTDSYFSQPPCIRKDFNEMVVIILGIMCTVMVVAVFVLVLYTYRLKKKPRWKRRYVVNRVKKLPLTSRPKPDHCEISIEDCCNMNICETPCFEPQLREVDETAKREERKQLIDNMEYSVCVPCNTSESQ